MCSCISDVRLQVSAPLAVGQPNGCAGLPDLSDSASVQGSVLAQLAQLRNATANVQVRVLT